MSVVLAVLGDYSTSICIIQYVWLKVILLVTVKKQRAKRKKNIKKSPETQLPDNRKLSLFLTQITSCKDDCISQSTSMHFFPGLIQRGCLLCRVC